MKFEQKDIGKKVNVVIDRPLGSRHPRHNDLIYPVNYGYIPKTLAEDGMEQDAYILGVDYPISTFEGIIIAIIHRENDIEDKLIVTMPDKTFTDEEIIQLTWFQESYFKSKILR